MQRIRPFVSEDIPQVGDLFIAIFRSDQNVRRRSVLDYFEEVYFQNPWREADLPCLVYEGGKGEILGFFGVVPRRMTLNGQSILAAVGGNLMVRPDRSGKRNAFATIELIRRFMAGKQDLAITDTGADPTRRIWERVGGYTARLYSLHWSRPIRRLAYRLAAHRKLSPILGLMRRCSSMANTALAPLRPPWMDTVPPGCCTQTLSIDELLQGLADVQPYYSLQPDYERESLSWLLEMAAGKKGHGELKRTEVRESSGRRLGWYIYYLNSSGTSRVLQLAARHNAIDRVFGCLVAEARRAGTDALTGRLDPRFMGELTRQGCALSANSWVLAHAKNPYLLDPLRNGDAFFTGLEGEWWMRFMEDSFEL